MRIEATSGTWRGKFHAKAQRREVRQGEEERGFFESKPIDGLPARLSGRILNLFEAIFLASLAPSRLGVSPTAQRLTEALSHD